MTKSIPNPKSNNPRKNIHELRSASSYERYYWILLGILIVIFALIRIRLSGIPLERDEGEYAYLGKLILDGIAPYKEAYSMKLPGTDVMYALIMAVFGRNILGIHLGLLLINVSTIVFFFLGFRKIFNPLIGLFTACVYGMMSVSPTVLGFAAHATQFVTFFVSLGIFFLARFYENRKLLTAFLVGLMFGFSFLMKQQAVFFIVFGGLAVILDPKRPDRSKGGGKSEINLIRRSHLWFRGCSSLSDNHNYFKNCRCF
jgi:hypothetical protein